jgi:hypothetical protein
MVSSRPKGDRAILKKFLGDPIIYNAKSVFHAVNASLLWLNNDSGVYFVQVFSLLTGQLGLRHFFRYRPLLPIGWRNVQIVHQRRAGGK